MGRGSIKSMNKYAILPGDPAGIGYEITVKALANSDIQHRLLSANAVAMVYANSELWQKALSLFAPDLKCKSAETVSDGLVPGSVYLVDSGGAINDFKPGVLSADCARCAHRALIQATEDVKKGRVCGLCTGPIHKGAMRLAGISEIGHTEMLARAFDIKNPLTMFMTRELNIFFYSRHLSLRQAIDALSIDKLVDFALCMNAEMIKLGFKHPHLAMAALNPHASDGGQFGDEEENILIPAAQKIRSHGVDMTDPIGADSVFAQAAKGQYDAVLSLYHDQGHIAAKTYDFERTISATLGLPCLRTSVDHGTAMDIAWTGKAQEISMITAIEKLIHYCHPL